MPSSPMPSRRARRIVGIPVTRSIQPAFGFRPVHAERVELRQLMQKPFLRRDRDDHSAVAQKNWLAKLKIPVPQGQSLTLECGEGENRDPWGNRAGAWDRMSASSMRPL